MRNLLRCFWWGLTHPFGGANRRSRELFDARMVMEADYGLTLGMTPEELLAFHRQAGAKFDGQSNVTWTKPSI